MRRAQPTRQCDVFNLLVNAMCSTYSSMRCAQPTSHDAQPTSHGAQPTRHDAQPTSPCDVLNLLGTMRNLLDMVPNLPDTMRNLLVQVMCSTY